MIVGKRNPSRERGLPCRIILGSEFASAGLRRVSQRSPYFPAYPFETSDWLIAGFHFRLNGTTFDSIWLSMICRHSFRSCKVEVSRMSFTLEPLRCCISILALCERRGAILVTM